MFVLLMLFLFKYIDDLIGKGFEWYIIMELMMYSSATNVAMALPLSVLLSSIMTYGSLGENYELVAIKSAGISLGRALYPMIIVVGILSISAFLFSDYMLPVANLKYYSLLYDARHQKSAFLIKEGVFNNSFPGYSIRVGRKGEDGNTLYNIMIYQKIDPQSSNMNDILAQEGVMYRSPDNSSLVLHLKNGIMYEEDKSEHGYDPRQTLKRFRFKSRTQKFDLSSFKMQRTNESDFQGVFQMMDLKLLNRTRDSLERQIKASVQNNFGLIAPYFRYFLTPHKPVKGVEFIKGNPRHLALQTHDQQVSILSNALSEARGINDQITTRVKQLEEVSRSMRNSQVEYQKKFTLSAACLALFLIGAPLGAIIRKGGLGLPVVVAVAFFLIYYIISTIGEKFVKDGDLSPVIGMWIAIAVLTPIGIFLSYKAANDSVLFDAEVYKRFTKRFTDQLQKITGLIKQS